MSGNSRPGAEGETSLRISSTSSFSSRSATAIDLEMPQCTSCTWFFSSFPFNGQSYGGNAAKKMYVRINYRSRESGEGRAGRKEITSLVHPSVTGNSYHIFFLFVGFYIDVEGRYNHFVKEYLVFELEETKHS